MNERNHLKKGRFYLFLAIAMLSLFMMIGCGSDGKDADPAIADNLQAQIDALNSGDITAESCAVCHAEVGEKAHQSV